jgi:hypothetical protein
MLIPSKQKQKYYNNNNNNGLHVSNDAQLIKVNSLLEVFKNKIQGLFLSCFSHNFHGCHEAFSTAIVILDCLTGCLLLKVCFSNHSFE